MAKKKQSSEDFDGGIGSLMSMVSSIDSEAEIIADSAYSNIKEWIPTGNLMLNACMGGSLFSGVPTGRITTLVGESGCAKSYLAVSICREAQKMGYTPIVLDSEGAYDSEFVRRLGADPTKFIIKQVNTITETSRFIANLCKKLQEQDEKYGQHDKIIIVLDSLGNLTSEKERDDTLSGNQKRDMTKQQEIKAMFRVNATPIARLQIPWVVVSHVYASMNMFSPGNVVSGGSGIIYNSSLTIELFKSKLVDKENDEKAAKQAGKVTKNGILVTAKPQKSRFVITRPVTFQIPFFKKPSPYVGIEQYMTWDNSGVCRGSLISERDYNKLSDSEKEKIHVFSYDGQTLYCQEKDTARGIVCRHLGRQVNFIEFFSDTVFTPEFLKELDENVIKPAFQLPDQNSFDDIKDIENSLGTTNDENDENDPIADATIK